MLYYYLVNKTWYCNKIRQRLRRHRFNSIQNQEPSLLYTTMNARVINVTNFSMTVKTLRCKLSMLFTVTMRALSNRIVSQESHGQSLIHAVNRDDMREWWTEDERSRYETRDVRVTGAARGARCAVPRSDELETAALNQQAKFIANIFPARS